MELAAGLLAPRIVGHRPAGAEIALIATTATLLGGDEQRLVVEVGAGLRLDLRDVAGTVAYHGRGRPALVDVTVRLETGATLVWAGEPLVVCDGADVTRSLVVEVADGARLLLRDRVALGRSGQAGGLLHCRTAMAYAGRPALVEALELHPGSAPGMLGDARVVDSATAVGWRPAPTPEPTGQDSPATSTGAEYTLAEPGAVARSLVRDAHDSEVGATFVRWRDELGRPTA